MLATEFALKGLKIRGKLARNFKHFFYPLINRIFVPVNAIAPGVFPTEMTGGEGQTFGAEATQRVVGGIVPAPSARSGR